MVRVGKVAPQFSLDGIQNRKISRFKLADFIENGPALLGFYIYDFSPVCTKQLCEISEMEVLTFETNISVAGISTDGPFSHREFACRKGISYPLLTDEFGDIHNQYGMVDPNDDERRRGFVVVDSDGVVRHKWIGGDNWDDWDPERLYEAVEVAEGLAAQQKTTQ